MAYLGVIITIDKPFKIVYDITTAIKRLYVEVMYKKQKEI